MRLLNTETLELQEFIGDIPYYAILSHRWGEGEISFQDIQYGWEYWRVKKGGIKILCCCEVAMSHGWQYIVSFDCFIK